MLEEELHNSIIEKIEKRKLLLSSMGRIWCGHLAGLQLISRFNKGFRILLCVIDIYGKYAWVTPLKDKIGITVTNFFRKKLDESSCKPNKIWADKGSEF